MTLRFRRSRMDDPPPSSHFHSRRLGPPSRLPTVGPPPSPVTKLLYRFAIVALVVAGALAFFLHWL